MSTSSYNERIMKFNCKDVAFLLIARFDSIDRLENAIMVVDYLTNNFNTRVYFWEFAPFENGIIRRLLPKGVDYIFVEDENPILHRTKLLNKMVLSSKEKYVSIWDIDIIAPISQVVKSIELLRNGVDFVLPYDGICYDISMEIRKHYFKERNIGLLSSNTSFMTEMYAPNCVGGAFFCNREAYIRSGLEREEFYGWGLEDGERFRRWNIQNQKIERVKGPLFHLTHGRGANSVMPSADWHLTKHRIYNYLLKNESWKAV